MESFLELERYQRWLGRFAHLAKVQGWPLAGTGGPGAVFRKGMYRSWIGWGLRQPRKRRRRLSMVKWMQETGFQEARSLSLVRGRKQRIRAAFEARRVRLAKRAAEAEARKREEQWGRRLE
jgi:hypothetical protein